MQLSTGYGNTLEIRGPMEKSRASGYYIGDTVTFNVSKLKVDSDLMKEIEKRSSMAGGGDVEVSVKYDKAAGLLISAPPHPPFRKSVPELPTTGEPHINAHNTQ